MLFALPLFAMEIFRPQVHFSFWGQLKKILTPTSDFEPRVDLVGWCAIPVFVIIFLFILTFAVLPKETTGRDYLTTVPAVGFLLLGVSRLVDVDVGLFE